MDQPPAQAPPLHKHSSVKSALLVVLAVALSAVATLIYHNLQNEKRRVSPSEEGFDLKESTATPSPQMAAPNINAQRKK